MADHTESSVRIAAPVADVLDVIADLESYPTWADHVRSVRVLSQDDGGWPVEAEFAVDAGVLRDAYVLRYAWDLSEDSTGTVSWTLVRGEALSTMDGAYVLEADGDGTRVTYRLAVELRIPMPGLMRRRAEKAVVGTALDELRRHVEA